MLFTALMVLLFLLLLILFYIIHSMWKEHVEARHEEEMEAVREETEEQLRQWTLWIYDPHRRFQERQKELMEYRTHLIQEWKRDGKSVEKYRSDLETLDAYINHYLDQYYEQLFADIEED